MRNYLYYLMLVCMAISGILPSCSSPTSNTNLPIPIKNEQVSERFLSKQKASFSSAPTTRFPEPIIGKTASKTFFTPEVQISEMDDYQKLEKLLAKYNPTTEEFRINPTEATSITSTNGTQIYFQEFAFKNDEGMIITEPVTIRLKVCDNPLAFLANNLVTETSNGRLLESGGMIYIEALQNEQKLILDQKKEAIVLFPKFGTDIPMQSFYGVPDGDLVKWELNTMTTPEESEESKTEAEITVKKDKSLHLRIHEFTAKLNDKNVHWMIENTDKSLLDWLEEQTINGTKLQSWLASPGHKIQTKLVVSRKGKIKLMESDLVAHEDILDELQRLFDQAPPLEIKSMSDLFNKTTLFLSFTGKKGVSEDKIRNGVKRKYGKFKADLVDHFNEKELENYILEINQLGWHNCDHFKDSDMKEDILVESEQQKPVKVLFVFDDFNSQLAGIKSTKGWTFKDIPLDISVRVIAFSFNGDEPLMANQRVKLTDKKLILPEFKPFSYVELESAFQR